ncbi:hypothetical protein [Luteimicrobium album]|uniref:hypothetical protein n=1 Tax=Luteimicrobium album TaxID=1054550 RepID=UPI0024E13856|nr:hypothetical protein [Luteimicrobium album]
MEPTVDAGAFVADRYPEARWALLTGSVVDASARTAGSDLDVVVCLTDGGMGHRDSLRWHGWPVEVFANPESGHRWFLEKEGARRKPILCRMIATGVQVAGEPGASLALQSECRALLDAGPGAPSDTMLEDLRYAVTDLLDDLTYTRDAGEAIAARHVLWERVGHFALAAAGRWDGGGKWLLRELRAWDPGWAARWLAAVEHDETMTTLAHETLRAAGGPLFEGYRRTAPAMGEPDTDHR